MNELPQQLANGLALGALYGLIAIGYTMVYGIVQLINFAHGEIFMIGGFGALTTYLALPSGTSLMVVIPLMIIGGAIASVAVATAAERFAYRPLRGAPRLAPLITAIGLSIVLQQLVWGFYPDAKKPRSFPEFQGESFKIFDNLYLQRADAFILVLAPSACSPSACSSPRAAAAAPCRPPHRTPTRPSSWASTPTASS